MQESCLLHFSVVFPFCFLAPFIFVSWLGKVEWGEDHLVIVHANFAFYLFKVFGAMEEAKVLFNLEDYSVKQVTLEQIFLTFANTDRRRTSNEINML